LWGGAGNDTLIQGPNYSLLGNFEAFMCGGAGDDRLKGGLGPDWFVFADGWGRDTITGEDNDGRLEFLDFTGCVPGKNYYPEAVTANLTIDLTLGKAFETTVGEGGANAVTWTPGAIEEVIGGKGNDTITGNAEFNYLNGFDGNDTINAVDSGYDDVLCGKGTDTANVDDEDYVSSNCETVNEVP
jgi:Ca2+-binding RTX toxin-like protein